MKLASEQVQQFLHHRYPFLMIDTVCELDPDKRVVAIKNVSCNEPYFTGHFPEEKIMPGVLVTEAMAQAAIFLFYKEGSKAPIYYLTSLKMRFLAPARPGDTIRIEATPVKIVEGAGIVNAEAYIEDRKIAAGEFSFKRKNE